jgi:hypothetical protein
LSKPNSETQTIEFYKLGEIVESANKAIAAFNKFIRKIAESKEDSDIIFCDYRYNHFGETIEDFATKVIEAVAENLDKHVEKVLNCGEDGDGYLIRTTLGDRVLVLGFPEIYPPEIMVLPPKEADWCKED